VRGARRRVQGKFLRGRCGTGVLHPRGPENEASAHDGGHGSDQADHRQLSGRQRRNPGCGQQP